MCTSIITLELSTTELDELGLLGNATNTMPWFKKSLRFGKKKNKRSRGDISQPTSFQHCYHATYDKETGEYVGLPPQWVNLVGPPERPTSPSSSSTSSSALLLDRQRSPEARPAAGTVAEVVTDDSERAAVPSDGEKTPRTDRSVSNSPVVGRQSSGNRPAPIIRGSDSCLEETIKYIRKHYRSSSSTSREEEQEEQYVEIHFGSRSRSGSLMQLRGQGNAASSSRANVPSYTSSSTSTVNQSNDPLSSNSAFCLSAPHDLNVVRSDLGLYDCDNSSASNTTLYRSRIHSPSESSGYFGSTMSSLCSSRISALSSAQQIHANASSQQNPGPFPPSRPAYSVLHEGTETPWLHPQMRPGQHQFSSLQRPLRNYRDSGSHTTSRAHAHGGIGPGAAAFANCPAGHYGTTPRAYAHRPRGESVDNGLVQRYYHRDRVQVDSRLQQQIPFSHKLSPVSYVSNTTPTNSSTHLPPPAHHAATQPSTSPSGPPYSVQRRHKRTMTSEQFRGTLELLVNKSNPRKDLTNFEKIGEGSTGVVYLARQISTGQKVAVKRMNLWKQQRRELLFNEVSLVCMHVILFVSLGVHMYHVHIHVQCTMYICMCVCIIMYMYVKTCHMYMYMCHNLTAVLIQGCRMVSIDYKSAYCYILPVGYINTHHPIYSIFMYMYLYILHVQVSPLTNGICMHHNFNLLF